MLPMDDLLGAALAGLVAGIAVAMPLGAIGVLLVHEGMSAGWRPAAAGATGVALVDLTYAALAVAAGTSLSRALAGWERTIHLAGAALLVLIAVRGLLTTIRSSAAPGDDAAAEASLLAEPRPWAVLGRFVGLTAINPLTAVYFVALAAGLGTALAGWARACVFVAAVFVASWAWQLTLAIFGTLAGARLPARARQATGLAGYLVVLGYAVHLAIV
jgi:threonine/homoserine/homoserine lactone efflux protein